MGRHALLFSVLALTTATPRALADTYVTFAPPNAYNRLWSTSEWWGLEPNCGLFPHRGKPQCCQCGPEDHWFVTLVSPSGATLDVGVELAGLDHRRGQVDFQGHSMLVFAGATIGDGDPGTTAPFLVNGAATPASFTSLGTLSFLDDHTYVHLEGFVNAGVAQAANDVDVSFLWSCLIQNLPGATWTFTSGANLGDVGGAPQFENHGTIVKLGSAPTAFLADLSQSGAGRVSVLAGELALARDVTAAGWIQVDAGGQLSMASGGFTTDVSGVVSGAGDVHLGAQRTATFRGTYDVGGWTTVDTNAHVVFAVPATTGRLAFADSSGGTMIEGELVVEDELLWDGGELVDGRMEVRGLGRIGGGAFGVPVVEDSRLVFTASSRVTIEGAGLRGRDASVVENDGSVTLSEAPLHVQGGTTTFLNRGSFEKRDGTSYVLMDLLNEGQLVVTGSTLVLAGDHLQTDGETRLDGGTIDMANFEVLEIEGGLLAGHGTVQGEVHLARGATLSPGFDDSFGVTAGELVVEAGPLVQDRGSVAHFDLGGLARGTEHDAVTGASPYEITLGGRLSLALVNGYESNVGPADVLVLYDTKNKPLAGSFQNVPSGGRLWTAGGEGSFVVHYGPGSPHPESQVVLSGFRSAAPRPLQ